MCRLLMSICIVTSYLSCQCATGTSVAQNEMKTAQRRRHIWPYSMKLRHYVSSPHLSRWFRCSPCFTPLLYIFRHVYKPVFTIRIGSQISKASRSKQKIVLRESFLRNTFCSASEELYRSSISEEQVCFEATVVIVIYYREAKKAESLYTFLENRG